MYRNSGHAFSLYLQSWIAMQAKRLRAEDASDPFGKPVQADSFTNEVAGPLDPLGLQASPFP